MTTSKFTKVAADFASTVAFRMNLVDYLKLKDWVEKISQEETSTYDH
jgi:hypothetical protein